MYSRQNHSSRAIVFGDHPIVISLARTVGRTTGTEQSSSVIMIFFSRDSNAVLRCSRADAALDRPGGLQVLGGAGSPEAYLAAVGHAEPGPSLSGPQTATGTHHHWSTCHSGIHGIHNRRGQWTSLHHAAAALAVLAFASFFTVTDLVVLALILVVVVLLAPERARLSM